jgi:hypothetical protein
MLVQLLDCLIFAVADEEVTSLVMNCHPPPFPVHQFFYDCPGLILGHKSTQNVSLKYTVFGRAAAVIC